MSTSPSRDLGVSDDPHAVRLTLRDCLEAALKQSQSLSDKVIDGLASGTERTHGMSGKNSPHPGVKVATDLLVKNRAAVRKSFNEHLRKAVYGGVGLDGQSQQLMRFEDLKLFEEDQLDESIEIARAQQEITFVVDDTLPQLDALMSSMLGWITVQPQINPLRPEIFVRALRESVAEQIENVDLRGVIITPAAGRLGILLRKLYAELSAWMSSSGVEPAAVSQPHQSNHLAKSAVGAAVGNSVARTLLTLDRLRRLLAGELDGDGTGKAMPEFMHTVPASVVALQDMRQVEAMVQRLADKARLAAQNPDADAARRRAGLRLAMADNKNLGKQLGEEVVRLMLDNLIQDDRLLPQVRSQLQTLEPLLMQIAKVDARLFSDKQHAARQFLDRVTNRSMGFTNERDESYRGFVASVESTIRVIAQKAEAREDVSQAFTLGLKNLEETWSQLDMAERARREEAARALLRAEQRNMLAQYLADEYRSRTAGKAIPQTVVDFVCGPWAQVVAEAQLRCTDGTSDPEGYHELVAELYWSVQPRKARRNLKRLVEMIPALLTRLRQGLQLIEFPRERISDFFEELISLHEASLEGARQQAQAASLAQGGLDLDIAAASPEATEQDAPASVSPTEDFKPSEFWLAASEANEAGYVSDTSVLPTSEAPLPASSPDAEQSQVMLGTLPVASWVELCIEGQWIRAQLTWVSPHRSLFMFASRGGKAHSMSRRTMERLREQGMIRVVSDGHMVENALDAVAQTALRNSIDAVDSAPSGLQP